MKKIITVIIITVFALSSCVQEEFEKKVTFIVDTNGIENVNSIGIRGDFLPKRWKETVFLLDENKDGKYEITFTEKTAAYGIEFKFVKNDTEYELKGKNNREIVFEYKPETITYEIKFNEIQPVKFTKK